MTIDLSSDFARWPRITFQRAVVLAELAKCRSLPETAARLGITPSGLKSHIRDLRDITGCQSARELGTWWLHHRAQWVKAMAGAAGLRIA